MRNSYDQIKNFFYDIVKEINIDPSPETIRFRNEFLLVFIALNYVHFVQKSLTKV